ncbi:GTP-binding protein [Gymnodinialimonas hymeniacidonis]|uniref:CobW family GTP-binding protein n=1 Tax=Gymnodinialimonas hymeniacidonis TaxID=3126508 RepID=UPI0034C65B11
MTVISGYLGAGKTTLINRVLADPHGLRILVMVNDFGAINIDEHLLISRDEDTIALSNGCVCCTMGADLFMAIGDALDRRPRPDHLFIEASGISDPARIANAALAEPDLSYAGIVTVVDGQSFTSLKRDPLIGPQYMSQIEKADLIWVSKEPHTDQLNQVKAEAAAPVVEGMPANVFLELIGNTTTPPEPGQPHADYSAWGSNGAFAGDKAMLRRRLEERPTGLFRVKGIAQDQSGIHWRVQVVGQQVEITPARNAEPGLVGIGLSSLWDEEAIQSWWPIT